VIGITPKYRALFSAANYPQYQPGATFWFLPEHTLAFGVTYARPRSSIGVNITASGRAQIITNDFYFQNFSSSIRLPKNRLNITTFNTGYPSFNAPYALADLVATHRFSPRIEGVLQVQNLGDQYTQDYYAAYASLGRQVKFGARVRTL
jgi:outer membrane receptor for ferric coprogen and ferric-rhodotorulic acid